MPTPAGFDATIAAALTTVVTGQSLTTARMASDLDSTNEPVPDGETRYQLQVYPLPPTKLADSEAEYRAAVFCAISLHYKIADPRAAGAETDYTLGAMGLIMQTLTTPGWWEALSGFHFMDAKPVGSNVLRVGNVVSFTVQATVTINPP